MKPSATTLFSRSHYCEVIAPLLPPEAFQASYRKLLILCFHISIVFSAAWGIGASSYCFLRCLIAVVMGHSMACIGFLAHDLSHRAIRFPRRLQYFLEVVCWAFLLIPATVWRRVHNQTHHAHSNTPADSDRLYFDTEQSIWTDIYIKLFYPQRTSLMRWNPLVGAHIIVYSIRNTIAALCYPQSRKPALVPAKPAYSRVDIWKILFELSASGLLQMCYFHLCHSSISAYLWSGPFAAFVSSTVAMAYINTNHALNPVTESVEPVLGSTSVQVPELIDCLHSHFSYHTEHHLFPNIDSRYYPLVSSALKNLYPERYNRIPIIEAWRHLWNSTPYIPQKNNNIVTPFKQQTKSDSA